MTRTAFLSAIALGGQVEITVWRDRHPVRALAVPDRDLPLPWDPEGNWFAYRCALGSGYKSAGGHRRYDEEGQTWVFEWSEEAEEALLAANAPKESAA